MSDSDKTLQTKHARITGQDMRDHWGPIIDQIADETADIRDARIEALEAENMMLREERDRLINFVNIMCEEYGLEYDGVVKQ